MEPATKQIILVSIHFTILFTAFTSFQTIVTKIHQDQGDRSLGPFRFAVNYSAMVIGNLFVSNIGYSQKWQITFATLAYVFNYLTGFFMAGTPTQVKYAIAAFGAIINGIGASFLWTSIGSYIHKVCHYHNKIQQKGHYFGIFNTLFCCSTILGAIVVTFGLSYFSHSTYFILVSSVAFLAFLYGFFFIKDIKLKQRENQQQQKNCQSKNLWKQIKISVTKTLKFYPIMKYTLPLILIDGANMGIKTSTMLHLMPNVEGNTKQNNLNAGICIIIYGVGSTIGGYLGSKLCDKLKIKKSSLFIMTIFCLSCLFNIWASISLKQMWTARLACFFWGFLIQYITGMLMVIGSRLYGGRKQAFAVTKQFNCLSFVAYQVVAMSTNNSLDIKYIMIVMLALAIPAFWGIVKSPKQRQQQVKDIVSQDEKQYKIQQKMSTQATLKDSLIQQCE